MFCREQVARLSTRLSEIEAAGARLVVIGNGTADYAKHFRDTEKVELDLYTDPGKRAYKALGLKHDKLGLLKPSLWKKARRARKSGHKQSAVRGDPFQNGGVAVIAAGGGLKYLHVDGDAGDHADLDEVIAVLAD